MPLCRVSLPLHELFVSTFRAVSSFPSAYSTLKKERRCTAVQLACMRMLQLLSPGQFCRWRDEQGTESSKFWRFVATRHLFVVSLEHRCKTARCHDRQFHGKCTHVGSLW